MDGRLEDALVIIMRTGGCRWAKTSGCLMCGYSRDTYDGKITTADLTAQYNRAMEKYSGQKIVKIFNSGSFLDENEIPPEVRDAILKDLDEKAARIVIESRAEFITDDVLDKLGEITGKLEVALGLETASDEINKSCVNKGATFDDYKQAAGMIHRHGYRVRSYVLLKPPFLTESDAITDTWNTMEKIRNITDVISINPVNVQKWTVVEKLWKNRQYRPPWLWSVLELLKRLRSWEGSDNRPMVISHPSGVGTNRGVHNCSKCDREIIKAISDYSNTQSHEVVERALRIKCDCFEKWQDLLELEEFTFASCGRLGY